MKRKEKRKISVIGNLLTNEIDFSINSRASRDCFVSAIPAIKNGDNQIARFLITSVRDSITA